MHDVDTTLYERHVRTRNVKITLHDVDTTVFERHVRTRNVKITLHDVDTTLYKRHVPAWFVGITKTHLFKYTENFTTQKKLKKSNKSLILFHISAQNIDCGYPLEPPRRGGSNEYIIYVFEQK